MLDVVLPCRPLFVSWLPPFSQEGGTYFCPTALASTLCGGGAAAAAALSPSGLSAGVGGGGYVIVETNFRVRWGGTTRGARTQLSARTQVSARTRMSVPVTAFEGECQLACVALSWCSGSIDKHALNLLQASEI